MHHGDWTLPGLLHCVCAAIMDRLMMRDGSRRPAAYLRPEVPSHLASPSLAPFALILPPALASRLPWKRPSGRGAKRSVSEEGHPLGVAFGTNTAAAFPLLCPSVGFGPVLWSTAQIWPGISKHACTAARALCTGLFCKYCRRQLNVGMEPGIGGFGQRD